MRKKHKNREFRFNEAIDDFDMDNIILDLGFDVKFFNKKTWEKVGKPKLVRSPIQMRLGNQYKIYLIGKQENIEVNIDGVRSKVDFEVIEIIDDTNPYPTLLGIDWEFDNLAILNLKKRQMSFDLKTSQLSCHYIKKNGSVVWNL